MRLSEIAEEGDIDEYYEEIQELRYWAAVDRFGCKAANRRLYDHARGKDVFIWV